MKNTVKALVGTMIAGSVGIIGMAHMATATKSQSPVAIMAQKLTVKALEASDGDGEMNDTAEQKQETAKLQR
jgi:hypothetical protein